MRGAVLDLGSNSFHLLVADVDDGRVRPVARERTMLHLGRAVGAGGRLPAADLARATVATRAFAASARRAGATELAAVATAAVRTASNRADVARALSDAAGTPLTVLSGADEARLSYLGARRGSEGCRGRVLMLDLGGGSLELATGTDDEVTWSTSFPLGSSRLAARVGEDRLTPTDRARLAREVHELVGPSSVTLRREPPTTTLALGGTIRALARMVATTDDPTATDDVHGQLIATARLQTLADALTTSTIAQRRALPGMTPDRADHVHIAAVVLTEVLRSAELPAITVSDHGLREGVLLTTAAGRPLVPRREGTEGPAGAPTPGSAGDGRHVRRARTSP
jgi:exopolyphosphatase / guanosine-5'-triphosphate,3'-diphosphate pyrophosphatase